MYPTSAGITRWITNDGSGGDGHVVPSSLYGGTMPWGKWYCIEVKKTPTTSEVWIDGVDIGTDSWTTAEVNPAIQLGLPNGWNFPANFGTSSIWFDGAMMSTSRIYPAALVDISNSATYGSGTVVKQHIHYISDGSISFEANLTGLGSGPYYLWVTNNGQTRNTTGYNLSGGGGGDTTAPRAPSGLRIH